MQTADFVFLYCSSQYLSVPLRWLLCLYTSEGTDKRIFFFVWEITLCCLYVLYYWKGIETDNKTNESYLKPYWTVQQQDWNSTSKLCYVQGKQKHWRDHVRFLQKLLKATVHWSLHLLLILCILAIWSSPQTVLKIVLQPVLCT